MRIRSSGLGKLPVWVVRMRSGRALMRFLPAASRAELVDAGILVRKPAREGCVREQPFQLRLVQAPSKASVLLGKLAAQPERAPAVQAQHPARELLGLPD